MANHNDQITRDERVITNLQHCLTINPSVILGIFQKYNGYPESIEELKNRISDERDFRDFVSLYKSLPKIYRSALLSLFYQNPVSPFSPYATQVIADIDNTTLENSAIAPVKYLDKALVPGVRTFLAYFSRGVTSVTFISARPKLLERHSIMSINRLIDKSLRFSFLTGDLMPIGEYFLGKGLLSRAMIENSYLNMAKRKFDNYLDLKTVYPHSRFIFIGDNTQGDEHFAKMIVDHDQRNWCAIRMIAASHRSGRYNHPRILYHASYFELIYRLICLGAIERNQILPMLQHEYQSHYYPHRLSFDPNQVRMDEYWWKKI